MIYQSFFCSTTSKSHTYAEMCPSFLLATVSFLHWDKEADFKPKPNRPRSDSERPARFCSLPYFIASNSSSDDIPWPSSQIATYKFLGSIANRIEIRLASALMLLSTISATALSKEYPMARMDNMRISAVGLFSRRLFILILPFCRFYSALHNYDSIRSIL